MDESLEVRKYVEGGWETTNVLDSEGLLHNPNGPSEFVLNEKRQLRSYAFHIHGKLHNTDGPALVQYNEMGGDQYEEWWQDGELHRDPKEGPAEIVYDYDGEYSYCKYAVHGHVQRETYREEGVYHRDDGPAVTTYNEAGLEDTEEYWRYGEMQYWKYYAYNEDNTVDYIVTRQMEDKLQEGQPAVKTVNGDDQLIYAEYRDKDGRLHRDDGPAIIDIRNPDDIGEYLKEEWYKHGERHREDGPAIVILDNLERSEEFHLDGKHYEENDYLAELTKRGAQNPITLYTTVEAYTLETEYWVNDKGQLHRDDGPAVSLYDWCGHLDSAEWYQNGQLHRDDGPASETYWDDGDIYRAEWYQHGKLHREDGPAVVGYSELGIVTSEKWFINGEPVRAVGDVTLPGVDQPRQMQALPTLNTTNQKTQSKQTNKHTF